MLSTGKVHIFPGIPSRWSNGTPPIPSIIDAQRAEAGGRRTVPQRHHQSTTMAATHWQCKQALTFSPGDPDKPQPALNATA